jgi:nitrite reductase/ring-hydroxylating ferredoxin subunit
MLSFTTHEHEGEWVIRLHHDAGFISLGSANGKQEAQLIVSSLNLSCSDWASSNRLVKASWERYAKPSVNS